MSDRPQSLRPDRLLHGELVSSGLSARPPVADFEVKFFGEQLGERDAGFGARGDRDNMVFAGEIESRLPDRDAFEGVAEWGGIAGKRSFGTLHRFATMDDHLEPKNNNYSPLEPNSNPHGRPP